MVVAVAADVADRGAMFFEDSMNVLGECLTALFRQGRDWNADKPSVVGRIQTKVGCPNGFLDRTDERDIIGLDRDQRRVRRGKLGDLVYGSWCSVVIHLDIIENRNGCPARSNAGQLLANVLDGFFHPLSALCNLIFDRHNASSLWRRSVSAGGHRPPLQSGM